MEHRKIKGFQDFPKKHRKQNSQISEAVKYSSVQLSVNNNYVNSALPAIGGAYRFGNIVIIRAYFQAAHFVESSSAYLFTIPTGFRPKTTFTYGMLRTCKVSEFSNPEKHRIEGITIDTSGRVYQGFANDKDTWWCGDIWGCYEI